MALSRHEGDYYVTGALSAGSFSPPAGSIGNSAISAAVADAIDASKLQHQHNIQHAQTGRKSLHKLRSLTFNLDNGSGTTIDDCVARLSQAITITAARIVYTTETAGTVAAGNAKIGTTVGGAELVAATAYENSKAVGTATSMTLASSAVAANTPIIVRHTGVAATAAGEAFVEIEYTIDSEAAEAFTETKPIHTCYGATGTLLAIEAIVTTAATSPKQVTIDLQKGNQSTGFSSVLTAVITIDSTTAARQVKTGTFSTTAVADGDTLQLVMTASGASGNQAQGLLVNVWLREKPV